MSYGGIFDYPGKHDRLQEVVGLLEDPTVWNDAKQDTDWVGAWTNCHVSSFGYEELVELNPTHWMPLPESPNSGLSDSRVA